MEDPPVHQVSPVFRPARLGSLALRNRVIRSGAYEGMCVDNGPSPDLVRHHVDLAAGGVGMTTVAYCAVSAGGRTFEQQMFIRPAIVPRLRHITEGVHAAGGAASLQLGHCGSFSRNRDVPAGFPRGPSFGINRYGLLSGLPFGRAMTRDDVERTAGEFGEAAAMAREAGFDAVEVHLGHGYLLSQFLSPAANRRKDRYGGPLANRLRFPLKALASVREAVGPDYPVLAKTNLSDGFAGGLDIDEAVEVARHLESVGLTALVLSGGFVSRTPFYLLRGDSPLKDMTEVEESRLHRVALRLFGPAVVRSYPFEEMFFLDLARRVRQAVDMPLVLLGGIVSLDNMELALREGFDFVCLARALIHDPNFVNRLEAGEVRRSACDHCNRCIAEMDRPGGVRCVLPLEGEGQ